MRQRSQFLFTTKVGDIVTDVNAACAHPVSQKKETHMQISKNLGSADRIARLVGGALLVILALTGTIGVWGWLGLIFVATAFMNFCPIYKVLGVKTCSDC